MSGLCFRHFGLDDRRQSVNAFEVFLVEVALHELNAEMPLDLQNELEYVNGTLSVPRSISSRRRRGMRKQNRE